MILKSPVRNHWAFFVNRDMKRYIPFLMLLIFVGVLISQTLFNDSSHPESCQIDSFPLIDQPDEITCGPTSALMVLKFYGKNVTLKQVESETKTEWFEFEDNHVGMTAPEFIPKAMTIFGVKSYRRSGNIDKVKRYISQGKPVIVLVRSSRTTWHYVVVIGYDKDSVTIADPGGGIRWSLPTGDFIGAWQFTTDMQGMSVIKPCKACHGTGRWLSVQYGPLGVCEFCNGTGKETDFPAVALRYSDIYPMTMIVPQ